MNVTLIKIEDILNMYIYSYENDNDKIIMTTYIVFIMVVYKIGPSVALRAAYYYVFLVYLPSLPS